MRLPFSFLAEYRGVEAASSFTRKDTGEVVDVPAKFRFEYEDPSGTLELISVSQSQLDRAEGAGDVAALKRGQLVRLQGLAVLQPRGSSRDSYVQVTAMTLMPTQSASKAAA